MNTRRFQGQLTIRELIAGKRTCSQELSEQKSQMQEKSDEAENEQLLQNKRKTISGKGLLEKHQIKEKSAEAFQERIDTEGPNHSRGGVIGETSSGEGKTRGSSKKRLAPKNPILPPEELTMKSQVNSKVITSRM
jgi:hypothetical protein